LYDRCGEQTKRDILYNSGHAATPRSRSANSTYYVHNKPPAPFPRRKRRGKIPHRCGGAQPRVFVDCCAIEQSPRRRKLGFA